MIGALILGQLGAAQRDLRALLDSDLTDLEPFHPAVQLAHATLVCCDRDGQWADAVRALPGGAELLDMERELTPLTDDLLDGPVEWRDTMVRVEEKIKSFFAANGAEPVSVEGA